MARPLFARGSRGSLIETLQKPLLPPEKVDGIYGGDTTAAVTDFQSRKGLPQTGAVDSDLWTSITNKPLPPTFDRALGVTATMEGHGYALAEGNFDGAGITWGIVGYTLSNGEIAQVIGEIDARQPGLVDATFGALAADLRRLLRMSSKDAVAFADTLTVDSSGLRDDWRNAFAQLGENSVVQQVQYDRANAVYGGRAMSIVQEFGLTTELGFALAFDIAVQVGLKDGPRQNVHQALRDHPIHSEAEVRSLIAQAAADGASSKWRNDVLTRKMTFVGGSGTVHGRTYVLSNWGLGEFRM